MRYKKAAYAVTLLLLAAASQNSSAAIGDPLNSYEPVHVHGGQTAPSIAASARGDFAIAWADVADDGSKDIYAALYSKSAPVPNRPFGPFRVDSTTDGDQSNPAVAMSATADFIVVWESTVGGSVGQSVIFAQRFSSAGQTVGTEFRISESGAASESHPAVGMDAFGNFVVAWQSSSSGEVSIMARRFAADGTPVGDAFAVNSAPIIDPSAPAVAMGATGEFVIGWADSNAAYARLFASDGTAVAPEFSVGTDSHRRQGLSLAMDAHAAFVAAWLDTDEAGATSIRARQYLAGGTPAGPEIVVNQATPSDAESRPGVASDAFGDFAVVWDATPSADGRNAYLRQYGRDGSAQTNENFWFGQTPAVAIDADGDPFVATSYQNSQSRLILANGFAGPEDIDLAVTIADSADPVEPSSHLSYTVTVSNRHAPSTEFGIAAIDSAVGIAALRNVDVSLSGMFSLDAAPLDCWHYSGGGYSCPIRQLPAGGSTTFTFSGTAGTGWQASATAILPTGQYDSVSTNDSATETTTIQCPAGNGPGTVFISNTPATVEGQPATIEVTRTGGTCGAATVWYGTGSSSASPGASGTLTWNPGEGGSRYFTVPTIDDNTDEDAQRLDILLQRAEGAALGSPYSGFFMIEDNDDTPTVSISPSQVTKDEGGFLTFTVTLSRPSSRARVRVTLGGTATYNQDYHTDDTLLTFSGSNFNGNNAQEFRVFVFDDSLYEGDETVTLTLSDPTNVILASDSSATITIKDNDPVPVVSVWAADNGIVEGGRGTTVQIGITPSSSRPITVPLIWSGTATNGADFSAPTSVTFVPGGLSFVNIPIAAAVDSLHEGTERAILTLGTPTNAVLGVNRTTQTSIYDIDPEPTVSFAQSSETVQENAGLVHVTVQLSAVSGLDTHVSILTDGSATAGKDYSAPSEIVIPAGTTTGSLDVRITDDPEIEQDETANLRMGALINAAHGQVTSNSLTIKDNDPVLPVVGNVRGVIGH